MPFYDWLLATAADGEEALGNVSLSRFPVGGFRCDAPSSMAGVSQLRKI